VQERLLALLQAEGLYYKVLPLGLLLGQVLGLFTELFVIIMVIKVGTITNKIGTITTTQGTAEITVGTVGKAIIEGMMPTITTILTTNSAMMITVTEAVEMAVDTTPIPMGEDAPQVIMAGVTVIIGPTGKRFN
jgi:hypothetical protein